MNQNNNTAKPFGIHLLETLNEEDLESVDGACTGMLTFKNEWVGFALQTYVGCDDGERTGGGS